MLIRQIRSLGSPGKKTGEQADLRIGSLRLLQDTHLIFRGSNFSPIRQGGLFLSIVALIKGFMRSGSSLNRKRKILKGAIEGLVELNKQTSNNAEGITRRSLFIDPIISDPLSL